MGSFGNEAFLEEENPFPIKRIQKKGKVISEAKETSHPGMGTAEASVGPST